MNTPPKLLIKIPTRERGYRFLDLYYQNITDPNTRILLSIDHDCPEPPTNPILIVRRGKKVNKIEAINRDIEEFKDQFDILLLSSDDIDPQEKGFDSTIISDMTQHYPDGDGCLWYNTEEFRHNLMQRTRGKDVAFGSPLYMLYWICMMPIVGMKYYNRFGYVYHPSYQSLWCDNEQTEVAKRLKRITCIDRKILIHQHPTNQGNRKLDRMYIQDAQNHKPDMANFMKRKSFGFK
jgi:hypothetical protein